MNNKQIVHNYVYANEFDEYSKSYTSISFHHEKLYSYSSILAIKKNGQIHIDYNTARYSHTSIKHASYLRNSIPETMEVFEYDFSRDPIEWYLEQAMTLIIKQERARKIDYISQALQFVHKAMEYMKVNRYDVLSTAPAEIIALYDNRVTLQDKVKDIVEEYRNKIAKQKKREDEAKQKANQEKLDKFTGGGTVYDPNYKGVYIKIIDDLLYTTNSITVSAREAKVLYQAWKAGKDIIGMKLFHYTVVHSNKDFVTIGCTTISAKELEKVFSNV